MNTDKLVPIDFSRKITPFVAGDIVSHPDNKEFTLDSGGANKVNEGLFDDYFIVSYADRPNTGKQPVGDDVVVDMGFGDSDPAEETGRACEYEFGPLTAEEDKIYTWKPNHAYVLKQYQESLLAEEAELMDDIAMNGGEHYEQAHHVALQTEALGDAPKELDIVINPDVKSFDEISDNIEAAIEQSKPVFTQEALEVYHGDEWHECIRFGFDIFGSHAYQISSGEFRGEFNATSKPSDFRKIKTEEDKLREAIAGEISLRARDGLNQIIDELLSSDKFEIKLKG